MVILAVMVLWGLASISFALGVAVAVHGSDGKKIDWSVFGWAPVLFFLTICWVATGVGLGVKFG